MILNRCMLVLGAAIFLSTFSLKADEIDIDQKDYGSRNIEEPAKQAPFAVAARSDVIGNSEIERGFFKGDKVRYGIAELEVSGVFYYCPDYEEGVSAAIRYSYNSIQWSENPWFNQNYFNTVSFSLVGFSHRLTNWFWQTQLSLNVDADEWNFDDYTNYDLVLWGRYTYCEHIGVHIGFLVETGMRMDRVYPIFGFDWQISNRWKLNLVYPVNLSLEYHFNKTWFIALAERNFDARHRIRRHQCQGRSLIRYENEGIELAIKYQRPNVNANIHVGYTVGGKIRIADHRNHHPYHYRLEPAGYVGGEVDFRF